MENLNFDKEITALPRHRSVQRFHFRGGSRSCQIARKILCQRIRKVTAQREFATVNIKVPSFVYNPAAETWLLKPSLESGAPRTEGNASSVASPSGSRNQLRRTRPVFAHSGTILSLRPLPCN